MRSTLHTQRGFTLTEMLVVVSIIVVLTALSIPALIQMGVFSSNKSAIAAREYYEMLRAARMYATTHNVETALVYQARLVYETANDDVDPTDMVPIIDAYAVCRRLTATEIQDINADFLVGSPLPTDRPVFVPVPESNGRFREMPQGTCILPEIFEVEGSNPGDPSRRALSAVYVVDPGLVLPSAGEADRKNESGYILPLEHPLDDTVRLHYELEHPTPFDITLKFPDAPPPYATRIHAFPAHRFSPSGEIIPHQAVQRFRVRVGMLPTFQPDQRFVTFDDDVEYDPDTDPTDTEKLDVLFNQTDPAGVAGTPEPVVRFHDPRREIRSGTPEEKFGGRFFLENAVTLNIYTATGRVEIIPPASLPEFDNT